SSRPWAGSAGTRCGAEGLVTVALSRRGRIWSYTDCRYRPPAPYVSEPDVPWEPGPVIAAELEAERMVVLGQRPPASPSPIRRWAWRWRSSPESCTWTTSTTAARTAQGPRRFGRRGTGGRRG